MAFEKQNINIYKAELGQFLGELQKKKGILTTLVNTTKAKSPDGVEDWNILDFEEAKDFSRGQKFDDVAQTVKDLKFSYPVSEKKRMAVKFYKVDDVASLFNTEAQALVQMNKNLLIAREKFIASFWQKKVERSFLDNKGATQRVLESPIKPNMKLKIDLSTPDARKQLFDQFFAINEALKVDDFLFQKPFIVVPLEVSKFLKSEEAYAFKRFETVQNPTNGLIGKIDGFDIHESGNLEKNPQANYIGFFGTKNSWNLVEFDYDVGVSVKPSEHLTEISILDVYGGGPTYGLGTIEFILPSVAPLSKKEAKNA